MEYLYELGISIVLLIQGLGEWLLAPMKLFSFLGSAEFYLLVMPYYIGVLILPWVSG